MWENWLTRKNQKNQPYSKMQQESLESYEGRINKIDSDNTVEKLEEIIGRMAENLNYLTSKLGQDITKKEAKIYAELCQYMNKSIEHEGSWKNEDIFIKKITRKVKSASGLTAAQIFAMEIACLKRLNEAAKRRNLPSHFPSIVWTCPERLEFAITHCGTSLRQLREAVHVNNLEEQIENIIITMEDAEVMHLDMRVKGQNMTVDKFGRIYLIDFDISSIGGLTLSQAMEGRLNRFKGRGGYALIRERIRSTIGMCPYIILQ